MVITDRHIPREEYLQGDLASEIRHEYVAGRVYAMSGGTLNQQRLAEPDAPFLALYRRDGADFRRETLSGPDTGLELPETGISIPLAELYLDVG